MGCGGASVYFNQLREIDTALSHILLAGLGPLSEPYKALYKVRGEVMGKLGLKRPSPRLSPLLKVIAGLSPGQLRVFFDIETGWTVEGRTEPGAEPVHRHISHDQAELLMRAEPPPDLVHSLLKPDPYIGE